MISGGEKTYSRREARKWARLEGFLGGLSPSASARLFETLEKGAANGDPGLPAPALLDILRTRLIERQSLFPPRKMTAARVFFAPFEDFFVDDRRGAKRRARIARGSLGPIWRLLTRDAACVEAGAAARSLDAAIARGGDRAALEDALFAAAAHGVARVMAHAETDAAYRGGLIARLGGEGNEGAGAATMRDLAEINFLLPIVHQLKDLQNALPRPVIALGANELSRFSDLYRDVSKSEPEAAVYLPLALARRLAAPEEGLKLYYYLRREIRTQRAHDDAAILVEALFEDLEGEARNIERDAAGAFDFDEIAIRLGALADYARGLIAEAKSEGDAVHVYRAEASRDIAAAALSRIAERARGAIRRAEPLTHAGGSGPVTGLRPDIASAPDREAASEACAAARFVAGAAGLGEKLERASSAGGFAQEAAAETRRYARDLISEIRGSTGAERRAAHAAFLSALEIAAALLPASEVALLKERAAAAAVSA